MAITPISLWQVFVNFHTQFINLRFMKDLTPSNSIASLFSLPENILVDEGFPSMLADKINMLILSNFERLIRILYRLDIDEKKLKDTLAQHSNEDAGKLIAAMIMEREQRKAETRQNSRKQNDSCEEERW